MRFRNLMLGLASVLVVAACTPQAAPDTSAADEAAIRTLVGEFVAAWNTADAATYGPMIAEDAVLMQPAGPPTQGHDAILGIMAQGIDIAVAQQTATVDGVIPMGDYAYAYGTWNVDPTPAAGPDVAARNGKWSVLYKRGADGAWQTYRWMWNEASPAVPAEG